MAFSRQVDVDVLRVLGNASISATYAKVGTGQVDPSRMNRLINNTDGDMFWAVTNGSQPASDATADQFFTPAGSFVLYDWTANSITGSNAAFCLPIGSQWWVRQSTAPTKNSVYVEAVGAQGE